MMIQHINGRLKLMFECCIYIILVPVTSGKMTLFLTQTAVL